MRIFLFLTMTAMATSVAFGQALPFHDDFNDGDFNGWEVIDDVEPQFGPSDWSVEFGELVQKSNIWS
ncbi:MAG: hypothetical protein OXL40_00780, partial [Bacteroidota bacterium]|nr:hypothetical protein [Bacteroidota bacterium]